MAQDKADAREGAGAARVIVYEGSRTLLGQELRIKEQIAEIEKELVPADVGALKAKCEELRAKIELAGAVRFIRTREDSGKMHYKCRTCWEEKPRKLRLEEGGECPEGHRLEKGKKKLVLEGNCILNIRLQSAEEYILADSQDD
jgi:DNA-directed RNA polymerase subunit RPC12/RpoP